MTSRRIRWQVVDGGDAEGQGVLFEEDELVERHFGKGEFRGMEFLHVNARRIVNEVPKASMLPFRYTINAYRGCSHACTYCLAGDTPILMADGRTKPISGVRAGDRVYGTVRRGSYRRYVVTEVLDHWSTVKPAYRVTLEDGTELVASGDHRFLSDRGWKHVTGTEHGATRRPHLTTTSRLLGPGSGDAGGGRSGGVMTRQRSIEGTVVQAELALRVVSVDALGIELPMYDITTGTGDFVANGVVSHNCFARPTHAWLDLDIARDFERVIVVKVNAAERLRAELSARRWAGEHIAMGTNTDPYQRAEGKYHLTRGIVEVLSERRNPFSILTKSTLIVRDLDLLTEAASRTQVRANFSIGTLDPDVWRLTEPGTPPPWKRVEAVARLNEAGVECGVLIAPVLPGLSDRPDQIEAVVKACVDAGASSISAILLHLRPGVKEHYLDWLATARPDLLPRYDELYPRAYASKQTQNELTALVRRMVDRHRGHVVPARSHRLVDPASGKPPPATRPPARRRGSNEGAAAGASGGEQLAFGVEG